MRAQRYNEKEKTADNKNINDKAKRGGLIGNHGNVLSIYIRARERDAHFTPPLLASSLILQTLAETRTAQNKSLSIK